MCSQYWNLTDVEFVCPSCRAKVEDTLQTHYMGEVWSCNNYYHVGEPVKELAGVVSATLGPHDAGYADDFIGSCDDCGAFIDFGGRIEAGRVVDVWPYQYVAPDGQRIRLAGRTPGWDGLS